MINTYKISGLTCPACFKLTQKKLEEINGVQKVTIELDGTTEIISENKINKDEITRVLTGTDFSVEEN